METPAPNEPREACGLEPAARDAAKRRRRVKIAESGWQFWGMAHETDKKGWTSELAPKSFLARSLLMKAKNCYLLLNKRYIWRLCAKFRKKSCPLVLFAI